MTVVDAIPATLTATRPDQLAAVSVGGAEASHGQTFAETVARAVADAEQKVRNADEMVRAFAIDDSVPVHQVTIALQEARLAVDLAMQIRSRLVEGYREIMNMQL